MAQIAGACRFVYNVALEQRRDWYRPGRRFSFASQCREVTMLRAEVDWLKACPVHTLQQALKDLDRASQNWWAGRAEPPTPRKKGVNDSSVSRSRLGQVERTGRASGRIKLPSRWVRLRGWQVIPGDICNATVSRRAGQWYVAVQWQQEAAEPVESPLPSVGIDRGITVFAALSDGTSIAPVNHGKQALRSLRRAQRNLSRKRRGSCNRRKAIRRVAKSTVAGGQCPQGLLHKVSRHCQEPRHRRCGALKVRSMSASARHLSRARAQSATKGWPEPRHPRSGMGHVQPVPWLQAGGSWR
jgi:putative transposase